jgi:DNA-binding protein HU-beta
MNKSELISKIAEGAGLNKAQAAAALNATLDSVTKSLASGEKVTLVGFGTFTVKKTAERTAPHPKTKEPILISAKSSAKFKPGKELNEAL